MRTLLFTLLVLTSLSFDSTQAASFDVHEIFRKVWSPYCKGVSLQECTSSQAQELRDELKARVERGETQEQILSDLEARYGDRLRMMPDRGGRENLAWQLPWLFAFAVIAAIFVFAGLRRKKKPEVVEIENKMSIDSKTQEKILNDLNNRL